MRVVFDTNVLVAAFLTEGVCSKLLMRARKGDFDLLLSTDIIRELDRVLGKKLSLTQSEISDVHAVLLEAVKEVQEKTEPIEPVCRDADDDRILACARQAHAEYIVTGDDDLLVIKTYAGTQILAPRDFESLFAD